MDHFSPSYFALLRPRDPGKLAEEVITGSGSRILKILTDARIRYMITGESAMTLYGVRRISTDLELLVEHEGKIMGRLYDSLAPEIARQSGTVSIPPDPGEGECRSICFYNADGVKIRIFADTSIPFDRAFERRTRIPTGSMVINVLSLEDLVLIKSGSDCPLNRADVKILRKVLEQRQEA